MKDIQKFRELMDAADEVFAHEQIDRPAVFHKKLNEYCAARGVKGKDFACSWRIHVTNVEKAFINAGNNFLDNDYRRFAVLHRRIRSNYCTDQPAMPTRTRSVFPHADTPIDVNVNRKRCRTNVAPGNEKRPRHVRFNFLSPIRSTQVPDRGYAARIPQIRFTPVPVKQIRTFEDIMAGFTPPQGSANLMNRSDDSGVIQDQSSTLATSSTFGDNDANKQQNDTAESHNQTESIVSDLLNMFSTVPSESVGNGSKADGGKQENVDSEFGSGDVQQNVSTIAEAVNNEENKQEVDASVPELNPQVPSSPPSIAVVQPDIPSTSQLNHGEPQNQVNKENVATAVVVNGNQRGSGQMFQNNDDYVEPLNSALDDTNLNNTINVFENLQNPRRSVSEAQSQRSQPPPLNLFLSEADVQNQQNGQDDKLLHLFNTQLNAFHNTFQNIIAQQLAVWKNRNTSA